MRSLSLYMYSIQQNGRPMAISPLGDVFELHINDWQNGYFSMAIHFFYFRLFFYNLRSFHRNIHTAK